MSPLRVPRSRVQILVPQNLGERNKVIACVGQELVSERVSQQMRVEFEATQRTVFVAETSDPST